MDWYWAFWIVVLFAVPEIVKATDKKPGGTLSEWVWGIFAIDLAPRHFGFLRRATLGAFLASLGLHFLVRSSVTPVIVFGGFMFFWGYYWFKMERGKL